MTTHAASESASDLLPRPWLDPRLPLDQRVELILAELTLEEKISQLGSVWPREDADQEHPTAPEVAPTPDMFKPTVGGIDDRIRGGVGQLTRIFGSGPVSVPAGVARLRQFQDLVVAGNRLGIPALAHEECLTGFATWGATAYPTPLAWAATFAPDLVRQMAEAIGADLAAVGVHQGLSPVLDVVRDYRWGRVEETLGEDPYLVGQVGTAYVLGLQSAGIIATLKHFAGYSASRDARNHAPVSIGPREFADVILPPFEMAIHEGEARSVMNSYTDVDGVPVAANVQLLTTLLRQRFGFTGTVVSDYWSIPFLVSMHRVADDDAEAGALALRAGIDVELPETQGFGAALVEQVMTGAVAESEVDAAVRRVLRHKFEAGLFDGDPLVPENAELVDLDSPRNRRVARALAEGSVILLSNDDGLLPLAGASSGRVAVIGPCADDPRSLLGCYAFPNHVLAHHPGLDLGLPIDTPLSAIRREFPGADLSHLRGVDVTGDDDSGITPARDLAASSDLVLLFVGDQSGLFGAGTSGEGCDAPDLALPGAQSRLVEAVLSAQTPTVLVVVSGRPYAVGEYRDRSAAILQTFFPGVEGASAIAGVLSGRVNPSGRLPVQIPGSASMATSTYLQPPLGMRTDGVSALDPTPAFAFGHGLSYCRVEYQELSLDADQYPTDGTIHAEVTVRNTDQTRACEEVVQVYATERATPVVRPVAQLVGFARVTLEAGTSRRVRFDLPTDLLSFTGLDRRRVVTPGPVVLAAGPSARDLPLRTRLRLVGPSVNLDSDRRFTATATLLASEAEAETETGLPAIQGDL